MRDESSRRVRAEAHIPPYGNPRTTHSIGGAFARRRANGTTRVTGLGHVATTSIGRLGSHASEWEQGWRAPSDAARTLLLIAAKNPRALRIDVTGICKFSGKVGMGPTGPVYLASGSRICKIQ